MCFSKNILIEGVREKIGLIFGETALGMVIGEIAIGLCILDLFWCREPDGKMTFIISFKPSFTNFSEIRLKRLLTS